MNSRTGLVTTRMPGMLEPSARPGKSGPFPTASPALFLLYSVLRLPASGIVMEQETRPYRPSTEFTAPAAFLSLDAIYRLPVVGEITETGSRE